MEARENSIQVTKTARYYQLGELGPGTRRLWIVLHGYGQLAGYFIRHFEGLVDAQTVVVAPEGLSRFYLDGKWDRVGATWMTKEDRLHEIGDYIGYLDRLLLHLTEGRGEMPAITLLGFSQGTATAWRWLMKGQVQPRQMIMWAGGIAADAMEGAKAKLLHCDLHFVLGSTDEYLQISDAEQQLEALKNIKPEARLWTFEGSHRMDAEVLQKIDSDFAV